MNTSDLTDAALDWAVQIAVGYVQPNPIDFARNCFKPSTNWSQGGPIIEREKMDIAWESYDTDDDSEGGWVATHCLKRGAYYQAHGPTPLIAAMRCYVASQLGDTVDVPEELTP